MEPAPFLDMIAGMRSDLDDERLETVPERPSEPAGHASSRSVSSRFDSWPSLRTYCYRVAGTVGLMTLPVMGVAEGYSVADAVSAGVDLGIALQLCNIIRDVGEDARRGRLYIPADELRDAGLTPEEVMAGVCDERYAALMETQMRRAEEHFERAKEGTKMLAPAARIPVLAAAEAYGALVDKVRGLPGHFAMRCRAWLAPRCAIAELRCRGPALLGQRRILAHTALRACAELRCRCSALLALCCVLLTRHTA